VPFAHTLKGRAGLLGMSEIAAIAGRLEAAARAGDTARAQRTLQALEAGLRPIVEGIDRVLPRSDDGAAAPLTAA
jgi:HPt (histidine-containing phosphotransfer) domain-containing protein